jgi:hypothetical protein
MFNNTIKTFGQFSDYGMSQVSKIEKAGDKFLADGMSVVAHTIEDSKNSKMVEIGAKVAGTAVIVKGVATGLEAGLSALNLDVSLDFVQAGSDFAIGTGVTMVAGGVLSCAFSNRKKTAEDMETLLVSVSSEAVELD